MAATAIDRQGCSLIMQYWQGPSRRPYADQLSWHAPDDAYRSGDALGCAVHR
jgi:hypothetical protein